MSAASVIVAFFFYLGLLNSCWYGNLQSGTVFELLYDERRYAFFQQDNATAQPKIISCTFTYGE